jgi:hypothetical protein
MKKKERVIVYYSNSSTKILYCKWAIKFNCQAIDAMSIFERLNDLNIDLKDYEKVFLFVDVKYITDEEIKKLEDSGLKSNKTVIFTTNSENKLSLYSKAKSIKLIPLPISQRELEYHILNA